jgi:carbonic anhydrase
MDDDILKRLRRFRTQYFPLVVCGHSHCGAIRALYDDPSPETPHMNGWLALARDAALPVTVSADALMRTEQRSVVLQLERLMGYPMVAQRVEQGTLFLHGWHYLIEEGRILILDVGSGQFVAADPPPVSAQPDTLQ